MFAAVPPPAPPPSPPLVPSLPPGVAYSRGVSPDAERSHSPIFVGRFPSHGRASLSQPRSSRSVDASTGSPPIPTPAALRTVDDLRKPLVQQIRRPPPATTTSPPSPQPPTVAVTPPLPSSVRTAVNTPATSPLINHRRLPSGPPVRARLSHHRLQRRSHARPRNSSPLPSPASADCAVTTTAGEARRDPPSSLRLRPIRCRACCSSTSDQCPCRTGLPPLLHRRSQCRCRRSPPEKPPRAAACRPLPSPVRSGRQTTHCSVPLRSVGWKKFGTNVKAVHVRDADFRFYTALRAGSHGSQGCTLFKVHAF